MKKQPPVTLAQIWSTELSHEIGKGFYEYLHHGVDWDVKLFDAKMVREHLNDWEIHALIIPVIPIEEHFKRLISLNCSLVSTYHLPDHPEIPQVDTDSHACGQTAAGFFIDRGYRRFAVVLSRFVSSATKMREQGFLEIIHARFPEIKPPSFISRKEDQELLHWLETIPKPVAIFCTDDNAARDLIILAKKEGLAVPDDIAVLGCQDDMMICEGIRPSVSSVRLPYRKVGYEAARLMDLLLQGKRKEATRTILLPPEGVTERMSTSALATEDEQLRRAVDYINRHFGDPDMSIATAAHHAGLSLRILQMRFKKELNCAPTHYLQKTRIEKAKELLRSTRMSMEEISESVGYGNGNYLSKAFSAVTGQTARTYRKTFQE